MASRQSMSSILKPPKVRAPLKEIEPVDQDSDENTATSSKRKVSFSGMNKIKMYNTCATSLTVNQAPMFDEKISMSSDSLNGDKTKLSGKFEKSDGQITFESTDFTNIEDNGRVIIEYESPSDNMEMTEAKVGELHDSMFLIGNYDSECMNSSNFNDSETNMEFTEAIQVGQIITVDMESDFSCNELSETMSSEYEQLSHKPSTQSSDDIQKMISNKSSNSSCMEFTCTNTKVINSAGIDVSNTEFTCMTVKSQKSALNDDYKSFSMELTQVPDILTSEDCNELIYESSIDETSYGSKNNSNCKFESETPEIDNDIMVCTLKNVDNSENNASQLSFSMISMDIDPTLECNEYEKNDIVHDNSELLVNKQNCTSSIETLMEVENVRHSINSKLNNSNIIDIYHQNSESTVSMNLTGSSFVQSISPEKNMNKSLEVEQPLNQSLNAHAISMFDPNQYLLKEKSIIVEENQLRKYSRKTMIHTAPLNVEIDVEKFTKHINMSIEAEESQINKSSTVPMSDFNQSLSFKNEYLSDKSVTDEKNYSRKSITSKSVFNKIQSYEIEDLPNKSTVDGENQQKVCSRKSIVPTNMAHEIISFSVNEDLLDDSAVDGENQQKVCSRKSIAPINVANDIKSFNENEDLSDKFGTDENKYLRKSIASKSVFNQSQSYEIEDLSDKSAAIEENQEKKYSRKSIAPTSIANEMKSFYENEDLSDKSAVEEEIHQKNYSRKSVTSKSVFNQSQSYEIEDLSDKSTADEEYQQKVYSRKSIVPTNMAHEIISFSVNEDLLDDSAVHEENHQKNDSRKSITSNSVFNQSQSCVIEDLSDLSNAVEENQQKQCSNKSVVLVSVFNENTQDTSEKHLEIDQKECSIESISPDQLVHDQSCSFKNENVSNTSVTVDKNVQKRYSRKSIGPASFFRKTLEDDVTDNLLLNVESNTSYMSCNSNVKPLDTSNNYKENSTQKMENQSALLNVISDDDLNSPFRKKSKKSIVLSNLINKHVKDTSLSSLNDQENLLEATGNQSVNGESEMDISMEYESKTGNVANISYQKISTSKNILHEAEECHVDNENHDSIYGGNEKKIIAPNELEKNEANLNEPAENHKFINESDGKNEDKTNNESTKIIDDDNSNQALNSKDPSFSYDIDRVTNTICVEGISNMSITDENNDCIEKSEDKSSFGNRKRSYSNRDCIPLSCSSFVSNSNVENCTNKDIIKTEIIKESPIKIDDAIGNTNNNSVMMNMIEEDFAEKDFKENLNNEVLEFLTRWTEQFVEKKLSLHKCTNTEWVFNILDSNIKLIISYSSNSNDLSFLKVENISFTTNIIPQDEITKFGVNWIVSKYNPKVYKQICYTSRDVELLLKCLLEDVHFLSKTMKNMTLVRDIHFVTFKDNKAVVVLHKMKPPLMVRFEILLSNIHKLSVKDVTFDCIFGSFNKNVLDEALENTNQDFKVLQSFIENLRALAL